MVYIVHGFAKSLTQLSNFHLCFPDGPDGKASACDAGDPGLLPGSGRSPGDGHGTPLQYSCLENPTDRGAGGATVHGVATVTMPLTYFNPT